MVPPVMVLNAHLHLCSNLSKNSSKSGSSLGDGANLSPSSKASLWLAVKVWEERFSMDLSITGSGGVLLCVDDGSGIRCGVLSPEVPGSSAEEELAILLTSHVVLTE